MANEFRVRVSLRFVFLLEVFEGAAQEAGPLFFTSQTIAAARYESRTQFLPPPSIQPRGLAVSIWG